MFKTSWITIKLSLNFEYLLQLKKLNLHFNKNTQINT